MPAGRNSVHGPANSPVFDPEAVRGNRKIYVTSATGAELPPFVVSGLVSYVGESPAYPVPADCTISQCAVTVGDVGGTSITFAIKVNGGVVRTHVAASLGLTTHIEDIDLFADDRVTVAITNAGTGMLEDFMVVLRV